jgi:hypothetical protein
MNGIGFRYPIACGLTLMRLNFKSSALRSRKQNGLLDNLNRLLSFRPLSIAALATGWTHSERCAEPGCG